jgi:hypothetical protein
MNHNRVSLASSCLVWCRCHPASSQSGQAEVFVGQRFTFASPIKRTLLGQMLGHRAESDRIWIQHQ